MILQPLQKNLRWLACGFLLQACLAGVTAQAASSVSQFGITWTFDRDYPTGQFANGDYWVVGPVKIVSISPRSTTSGGVTMHGSMLNPAINSAQGYDSRIQQNSFSATLNVARTFPLSVSAGSSLVSTESYITAATAHNPQLKTLAILTVLSSPAPAGSFRPAPVGTDKSILANKSQLDYSKLRSLPIVPGTPDLASVTGMFERPWNEQVTSWVGRYMHAGANQPTYGREIAHALAQGLLSLQLNYTKAQKETLLIRMVQYGIDVHGAARLGAIWPAGGAHNHGRKMPLLLAGTVLNNPTILKYADGTAQHVFQEDRQTWYVTQADVGRDLYTADGRPREEYIQSDVGLAEWGEQHCEWPNRDGRNWNAYYRNVAGASTIGHVLAARLMGVEKTWNWPAIFEYYDRYFKNECNSTTSTGPNAIQGFVKSMWSAYRNGTPAPIVDEDVATSIWQNTAIAKQTAAFTVSFDMMAAADKMDGVTGLSNGAADNLTDLAASVRFNTSGYIQARNGATFTSAVAVPYKAGVKYRVVMSVDVATKRYSVKVTPAGGATVTLASGYQFCAEQANVSSLNNLGFLASSSSHAVLNIGVESAIAPAPVPTTPTTPAPTTDADLGITKTSSGAWQNASIPAVSGTAVLAFDLVAASNPMDGVTALTNGSADAYSDFAIALRFAPNGIIDAINGSTWASVNKISYVAGTKYEVVVTIDVAAHRYSVTVKPVGGSPVVIANNWLFRSSQATVKQLNNIALIAPSGKHTISNVSFVTSSSSDAALDVEVETAPTTAPVTTTPTTTTPVATAPTTTTPVAAPTTTPAPTTGTDLGITKTSSGAYQNAGIPAVTGKAVLAFDLVAAASPMDGVTALTSGSADAYSDFAIALRFAPNGIIDAINGSTWASVNKISYVAGTKYEVVVTIDVAAHRYSVTVKPVGGSPVVIANNWLFRSSQATVKQLNNIALIAPSGKHTISNVSFE